MGFVDRLRMANMFPIRSGLGNAEVPIDNSDPAAEYLNLRQNVFNQDLNNRNAMPRQTPTGIQSVASMMSKPNPGSLPAFPGLPLGNINPEQPIQTTPPKYAGDPWANSETFRPTPIKPPGQAPDTGMSNDNKLFMQRQAENTPDALLNRRVKEQQIAKSESDMTKGQIVTVADPNDPTKQISARINPRTGQAEPIQMDGGNVQSGAQAKTNAADMEKRGKKLAALKAARERATEGLGLIDEIMAKGGNEVTPGALNSDTQWATGGTANIPYLDKVPWIGQSKVTGDARLNKLQGMLTLDLIRDLKEQSKTGATGFGALNLRELGVLENSASMLSSRNMDETAYARELERIKARLNMIMQKDEDELPDMPAAPSHGAQITGLDLPPVPEGYERVRRPDNKGWTHVRKGSR